jgi:hypothetical protein
MTITRQAKRDTRGWMEVINDAESEIAKLRRRVGELKASVRLFRERMNDGEPFPSGLKRLKASE